MDLLARREHSVVELHRKLLARDYTPDEIKTALDRLVRDGLLSNERFAAAYISARVRKGRGPVRLRGELRERGVAKPMIEVALDAADVDWFDLAKQVRILKFGADQPANYKEQARQSRFMQYRGFTHEQIRAAVGEA